MDSKRQLIWRDLLLKMYTPKKVDINEKGVASHFEMYLDGRKQIGADRYPNYSPFI